VTATLDRRRSAHRAPRSAGDTPGRRGITTPATMRSLLTALIALSLAWGALGGWVASVHASAASAIVAGDVQLNTDAGEMYQSIADADTTITAALLASSEPNLASLQHYQQDIARAAADMSRLRAAGGNQEVTVALEALATGLPAYTDDIAKAESAYALGYQPLGGSSVQVASEEAHLVLLPNAKIVFVQENATLAAAGSQATGLPIIIVALLLAIITGIVLYRAQRWLTRRTNRVFSVGLVLASALLVISAVWLAAGFLAARSDLNRGIAHGSRPAQELAQASIDVQQIKGDAVLNVISRSGSASFQDDFQTRSRAIGPGPGTLLTEAAAAQESDGPAATFVAAAERAATPWFTKNAKAYSLGAAANYGEERATVVGPGTSSSTSGYGALVNDIGHAIVADENTFVSAVTQGSGELDPLEPMMIIASLLMAISCGWGLSRRLAEYR
jgi:hypothetical protein